MADLDICAHVTIILLLHSNHEQAAHDPSFFSDLQFHGIKHLLQVQIIIVIPSLAPAHDNLLLFLALRHGVEKFLELRLGDLLSQLACLGKCDESVLDVGGTRFLNETDAAQTIGGFGVKDLVEDVLASIILLLLSVLGSARHSH